MKKQCQTGLKPSFIIACLFLIGLVFIYMQLDLEKNQAIIRSQNGVLSKFQNYVMDKLESINIIRQNEPDKNINLIEPKPNVKPCKEDFLVGNIIEADDPKLLEYVKKNHITGPSTLPYNLTKPNINPNQGQVKMIRKILNEMKFGFFIESGAYDGEAGSNTLYLERHLNWTGVLVEPQLEQLQDIKNKNRKCFVANVCLSPKSYPTQLDFLIRNDSSYLWAKTSSRIGNINTVEESDRKHWIVSKLQCLSMQTILASLNVNVVDYWSLDVEGIEMDVLRNFPFDKIFVKTMTIEHQFFTDKHEMKTLMFKNGFDLYGELARDYIYVHNTLNIKNNQLNGIGFKCREIRKCIYRKDYMNSKFQHELYVHHCEGIFKYNFISLFYLTQKGHIKYYDEQSCWNSTNDDKITLTLCNDENISTIDKWEYNSTNYVLKNLNNGKCLSSMDTKLSFKQCDDSPYQQWEIIFR